MVSMINEVFGVDFESAELTDDLADLGQFLLTLPTGDRARASSIFARLIETNRKRRQLWKLAADALSDVRMDMKYLTFDLESTRRERDLYLQMLAEADGGSKPALEDEFDDQ